MTREEARDLLAMIKVKEPGEFIVNSWWGSFVNDYKEALQMAIEALEQQPCEDCISRAKAIEEADKLCLETDYDNEQVIEMLNDLPSVTPKEKTGRWREDANKIDAQFGRHTYICSECGKYAEYFVSGTEVWWDRIKPNFCPNCGCRMRGDSNGNE